MDQVRFEDLVTKIDWVLCSMWGPYGFEFERD